VPTFADADHVAAHIVDVYRDRSTSLGVERSLKSGRHVGSSFGR
jgi:hypothetical protein